MRAKVGALVALMMGLALGGCGTVQDHRARQLVRWAQHWDDATRARLGEAMIARGDSTAMVYVALGTPSWEMLPEGKSPGEPTPLTWAYFGQMEEEAVDRVQFRSRNELRVPSPGGPTEVLEITFADGQVDAWRTRPTDADADLGREPPGRMGTIPQGVRDFPPKARD